MTAKRPSRIFRIKYRRFVSVFKRHPRQADTIDLIMSIRGVVGLISFLVWSAIGGRGATPIDTGWLAVADAQRSMKAPVVEKDAGVEALFWNVHVRDEIMGQDIRRVFYHYVRLKIFDEKGK